MTKKAAWIVSILAFISLLRPCVQLWQFAELMGARLFGVGYDAMPTSRLITAIHDAFGIVAASLVNWAIELTLAAIPAILLYRFLIRRDFDGVCNACASHKVLSWTLFALFVFFSFANLQWMPQLMSRPFENDCEPLPLDGATAQNSAATLELQLCHPDNDELVGKLRVNGEFTEEALALADEIDGYRLMPLMRDGKISDACYVSETVELSKEDLRSATAREDFVNPGTFTVNVKFNAEGKKKLRELTRDCMPGGARNPTGSLRRLAIVVNGRLVIAPAIREAITGGEVSIVGDLTPYEAIDLAVALTPVKAGE